jgi:hypothetical protein
VGGIPWGRTVVSFEARDEPARSTFLRLVQLEPGPKHLVRNEKGDLELVQMAQGRYHWLMRCFYDEASCFINVAPIFDK